MNTFTVSVANPPYNIDPPYGRYSRNEILNLTSTIAVGSVALRA